MHIGSLDKLPLTTTGSPLLIRCKTFLFVTFVIPKEKECHDVYTTLLKLSQPGERYLQFEVFFLLFLLHYFSNNKLFHTAVHIQNLYCFQYTSSNEELQKTSGWDYFTLEAEFKRQRVPNTEWTQCNLNRNYELCDTCMYRYLCLFFKNARQQFRLIIIARSFGRSTTNLCSCRGNHSYAIGQFQISLQGSVACAHLFTFQ